MRSHLSNNNLFQGDTIDNRFVQRMVKDASGQNKQKQNNIIGDSSNNIEYKLADYKNASNANGRYGQHTKEETYEDQSHGLSQRDLLSLPTPMSETTSLNTFSRKARSSSQPAMGEKMEGKMTNQASPPLTDNINTVNKSKMHTKMEYNSVVDENITKAKKLEDAELKPPIYDLVCIGLMVYSILFSAI